ncbi:MAG: hypothetical protein KGJ86_08300, partial [Chloroflexota bacterium]|nr:hypothetical protein [Chloroflexota bacterium]
MSSRFVGLLRGDPVFGLFVVLLAVMAGLKPALDNDLGTHLRTGRLILASHAIPRVDTFSF